MEENYNTKAQTPVTGKGNVLKHFVFCLLRNYFVWLIQDESTMDHLLACYLGMKAVSQSRSMKELLVKSLKTEVNVLSSLKHERIVKFFRMEEEQETAILLLEYMEGGSLMDWLKQGEPLQEPWVKKFTRQLLSAVNFLHTNGIKHVIHKDIKGANILLDKPRTNIKLADFGISTIMEQLRTATGQLTSNNEASFYWTSPELLGEETFGRNTDIWSVGCTVIEMLTTKPPLFFENLTLDQKRFRIVHCQVDPPENCSPGASEFLQRCLRPRSERPSAAELLTDPFVVDQQQ
ncbi:unnamed protein product [Porites evermanni]|uniref:Protein kinase domain-containing protein n=1 Tax=Porites evermanni TaxID=104178 RepID=A0ABN8QTS5_9CNID|nr:unnamed protein product [Porites evermanni]